jgi:acetoin utilization deacetylase AcuC-like enzyme
MSNLVFVYDPQFQKHLTPESHPESPNRLAAIEGALHRSELIKQVKRAEPRMANGLFTTRRTSKTWRRKESWLASATPRFNLMPRPKRL